MQKQKIIDIEKTDVLNKAREMKSEGYRLGQILALPDLTLMYCFVKDESLVTFRYLADELSSVESISGVYSYAFMYENEIKELFGINIVNINIDFEGSFYETSVKMPFRAAESKVNKDE